MQDSLPKRTDLILHVENQGVGPAKIDSFEVLLDGEEVTPKSKRWEEAFQTVYPGVIGIEKKYLTSVKRGDVVNLINFVPLTPSIALSSVSIGGAAAFL